MENKETVSLAYVGNVVDLWERLAAENIPVDLGSDQTSLHNPWAGGYYPVGQTFEESVKMMAEEPERFREAVRASLRRHVAAINELAAKGMYFFDYGNAFLLESSRAGADILKGRSGHIKGRRHLPLSVLRPGHHGTALLRLRFRPVPLGLHEREAGRPRQVRRDSREYS